MLNWDGMRMAQNLQNLQVFGAALVSCHPQNVVLWFFRWARTDMGMEGGGWEDGLLAEFVLV